MSGHKSVEFWSEAERSHLGKNIHAEMKRFRLDTSGRGGASVSIATSRQYNSGSFRASEERVKLTSDEVVKLRDLLNDIIGDSGPIT